MKAGVIGKLVLLPALGEQQRGCSPRAACRYNPGAGMAVWWVAGSPRTGCAAGLTAGGREVIPGQPWNRNLGFGVSNCSKGDNK